MHLSISSAVFCQLDYKHLDVQDEKILIDWSSFSLKNLK